MATAKKDNTMLYVLAAGAGIFFLMKRSQASGGGNSPGGAVDPEETDATIDTTKNGMTIEEGIAKAQEIAGALENAKVLITKNGKHVAAIRKGKKKITATKTRKVKKMRGKKLKAGKNLYAATVEKGAFTNFGV